MLLYSNRSHSRLVCQITGSVVFGDWRQILTGLFLAAEAAGLHYLIDTEHSLAPNIPNSYGLQTLGMVVAFAIVFRVNLAWQRYWEALTSVHCMYSKWGDAFMQFSTFCACDLAKLKSKPARAVEMDEKISALETAYSECQKYFSILSAMAANEIHHGDVQEMDVRMHEGTRSSQVTRARSMHQMQELNFTKRTPRLEEGHSSGQFVKDSCFETRYVVKKLPSPAEHGAIEVSSDPVHLSMTWIVKTLTMVQKVLSTPPPIQSRMYQELSNGYVHFTNVKKISDVPFPFNYAQLLAIMLTIFSAMLPVYVAAFTHSYIAGPLLTFMVFHSITCINALAEILENPFGQDLDDISLVDFHLRFLEVMEVTVAALDVSLHPDEYLTQSSSARRVLREEGIDRVPTSANGGESLPIFSAAPEQPVVTM
mmetsp:Transcript_113618/g.226099  ORF Transcript_113618/g.226099 Transcript_113618/m.226099 type:complete len:424 (+) Transcript_113618:112-1383(+)